MSTDLIRPHPSAGESIGELLATVRSESTDWVSDVQDLFDDIDTFLASTDPSESERNETITVREELAGLKALVEQQTDVLTALVNSMTGQASDPAAQIDQILNSVKGQFEQLAEVGTNSDD